jgi:hypothetical protein
VNPSNGDVYVGEYGGKRVKLIYGPNHSTNPDQIFKIAGNGTDGDIDNCDGPMNSNSALGAIGTMRVGPASLANPTVDPYGYLYFFARTAFYEGRLDYDINSLPATTKGVMRWNNWPTSGSVVDAQVRMRVQQTVNAVPRPDLDVAATVYGNQAGTAWTSAGLENAANQAPTHNPALAAYCRDGGPSEQLTWTTGTQLTYDLPVDSLTTAGSGGRFALAVVPPSNGLTYHYDGGLSPPSTATNDRLTVDFYPHSHGTAGNRPTMRAIFSPYMQPRPISAPPTIFADGVVKYVYAYHNNAVFRLNFASPTTFNDSTTFATTKIGRQAGIIGTLDERANPKSYLHNLTTPLVTFSGKLVTLDYRPNVGNWNFSLNRLNGLANTGSQFVEAYSFPSQAVTPPLGAPASSYVTYNGWGGDSGSAFFGLANNRIYRLNF